MIKKSRVSFAFVNMFQNARSPWKILVFFLYFKLMCVFVVVVVVTWYAFFLKLFLINLVIGMYLISFTIRIYIYMYIVVGFLFFFFYSYSLFLVWLFLLKIITFLRNSFALWYVNIEFVVNSYFLSCFSFYFLLFFHPLNYYLVCVWHVLLCLRMSE